MKIKKGILLNIITFVILSYFTMHFLYGRRGFFSYLTLKEELVEKYNTLNVIRSYRLKVENNATLLRAESLDQDILDEYARRILGLVSTQDIFFNTEN